ncbi:MAG: glycosyltransferase [Candidatus Sumerlaeia bacterium]|nr:glycosyltransferase [Candidatus Sumerlaeia bacterium]
MTRWVLLETAPPGHRMRLPGHHLAEWLAARGRKVAYVSVPVSPWHFLSRAARPLARRRWSQEGSRGRWHGPNLFAYIPRTLLPVARGPLFDNEAAWRLSHRLTLPDAAGVLAAEGFSNPDVVCLQSPLLAPLAAALGARRLVVRIEDALDHFDGMPRVALRHFPEALERADLVTVTARSLESWATGRGARSVRNFPNGVAFARFRRPASLPPRPADLPPGPVAVYVGALDSWFDDGLLAASLDASPSWRAVLIGPPGARLSRLREHPRVHFLGPKPQEQVPPYLWHADAGVIPFRRTPLIESVSPLKLFEYLAAGLPVIATRWRELEALQAPATLADGPAGWAKALADAETPGAAARAAGIEWARVYDWEQLIADFAAAAED